MHEERTADILTGRIIGSSKQIAQENCIMISKIVPHIPRAIVIQNKR